MLGGGNGLGEKSLCGLQLKPKAKSILQSGTSFQERKEDRGHFQYKESKRREKKNTKQNQAQLTEELREERGRSQTTGYC